jgi:hypothetical protein
MRRAGPALLILLAGLALSACEDRKKLAAEYKADDAFISGPAPPLQLSRNTPDAKISLKLDSGLSAYPELHKALFLAAQRDLDEFASQAREDRRRLIAKGVSQPNPYVRRLTWKIAAVTLGLISLKGDWYDDTGGVHPDQGSQTRLWDRDHNQMLLKSELFRPDADQAPLDAALCQAVTAVKAARMGPTDPKSWTCPKWADSQAVLMPSVRPYRAGGLLFLFDPYTIGAYAEGEYAVPVPLSVFQAALAPAWAAEFAGAPAPVAVKTRR